MRPLVMALGLLSVLLNAADARGDLLIPNSASGTGSYGNSPSLIIDGVLPPRSTYYADATNVYWDVTTAAFTIDLGGVYTVQNLTVVVDNNDDYLVEYSTDGATFDPLFTFLAADGPVSVASGGMDVLTTDPDFPTSPGDATTPAYVGRGFLPVDAGFLRIAAVGGDDFYSIGEIQAFGFRAVPEPTSLAMLGVGSLALLRLIRRGRTPTA